MISDTETDKLAWNKFNLAHAVEKNTPELHDNSNERIIIKYGTSTRAIWDCNIEFLAFFARFCLKNCLFLGFVMFGFAEFLWAENGASFLHGGL